MAPKIEWLDSSNFAPIVSRRTANAQPTTGVIGLGDEPLPRFLSDLSVATVFEPIARNRRIVKPEAVRRGASPVVALRITPEANEEYLLVIRHPSGALTFHKPTLDESERAARSTRTGRRSPRTRPAKSIEFRAPIGVTASGEVRRGIFGQVTDAIVDAIVVKIGSAIAETAVNLAEPAIWSALGRSTGLCRVSKAGLQSGKLEAVKGPLKPGPCGRALLFLHGTFSTTLSAFGALATTSFFDNVHELYGDAIYGYDHYTVSVTPEQNVKDLLVLLRSGNTTFDVITHSRGGLVLRTLVELRKEFQSSGRFSLGHGILVASPNEGTPLVTPGRWYDTVGWLANILDLFPPNPLTSNAAMIAHWISWFVRAGVSAADGLAAMDMKGDQIRVLQRPPSPSPDAFSALVSNYQPDQKLWARALDLGLTWFFDAANDLVVPTAGGWRIDELSDNVPTSRIGCFGKGGNITLEGSPPIHTGFFKLPETAEFLTRALQRQPQALPPINVAEPLPLLRRGGVMPPFTSASTYLKASNSEAIFNEPKTTAESQSKSFQAAKAITPTKQSISAQPYSSVFELTVIDPNVVGPAEQFADDDESVPFLLASYGGARVAVPFRTTKRHIASQMSRLESTEVTPLRTDFERAVQELTNRWGKLFSHHRQIRQYFDGHNDKPLDNAQLREFGELLFETLLPGDVRRLYDVARSRERDKLFVVFTSMIPWVFDMPWEFARDPGRGTFLATEDVHFIRNILTHTPVERLDPKSSLKMLIAVAEPDDPDFAALSGRQEAFDIRSGLQTLIDQRQLEIIVQDHMTPERLHHEVATGGYDIVHFIGHGYWDPQAKSSGLVLENNDRQPFFLGDRGLREILSGRGIRIVFLNACDTGRSISQSRRDITTVGGTAQDLFGRGVPNVVANQLKVGDRAAVVFARAFYRYVASGKTVAQATREARIAASYGDGAQTIDWAIPVVYARDPNDALVRPTTA